MAFYRCGSGGGTLKETVLWTNPDSTVNFAAQNVTLSDSISNYDYIKIKYRGTPLVDYYSSAIIEVSELKKLLDGTTRGEFTVFMGVASYYQNTYSLGRGVSYVNDTTLHFRTGQYIGASGTSAGYAIPTQIIGLKY